MKKLAVMITLFCSLAGAQVYQPISGWCQLGGAGVAAPVTLGGVPIQQFVQQSYKGCTITVYNHGTTTPATLYATSGGTAKSNPFQADTRIGFYQSFAATGLYDVQESGNVSPPVSLGTVSLVDVTTLPGGMPGGVNSNVQYNCSGAFCGSTGFTYNSTTQAVSVGGPLASGPLTVTGAGAVSGNLTAGSGLITGILQVNSTILAGAAAITGIETVGGGINSLGGVNVQPNTAQTSGGYIQLQPISYPTGITCLDVFGNPVSIPVPPSGMPTFGPNDLIMWNSLSPLPPRAGSPSGCPTALPPNVLYGINTNGYYFARGGYATDIPAFNAFHAFTGGVTAASITAGGFYPPGTVTACCGTLTAYTYIGGYMAMGHSNGPPATGTVATVNNPLTQYDGIEQGTFYWDDALSTARVFNGSAWVNFGSGSGGSPGGTQYNIQANNPLGTFYGDANFTYTPGTPNVVSLNGFYQAAGASAGLEVSTATAYNSIQSASGGMYALSFTGLNYVQTGNYSASLITGPPVSTSDSFHAGSMSYSTAAGCEALYNGTLWSCVGSPAGPRYSLQINNPVGSFYGDSSYTYTPGSPNVVSLTGFYQAAGVAGGFEAGSATAYNAIQAPSGGLFGASVTTINYVQTGNYSASLTTGPPLTTSDAFHAGAMSYSTSSSCEAVYTGSVWTCLGVSGVRYSVQINNPLGSIYGDANFTYTPGSPNVVSTNGYYQAAGSAGGFDAPSNTAYNAVQAPSGGGYALSFTALNYVQTGNYSGTTATGPPLTTSDTFNAGALSYSTASSCEAYYNGTSWICLSSASGTFLPLAGGTMTGNIISVNIIPDVTAIRDLGSPSVYFGNGWINNLSVANGTSSQVTLGVSEWTPGSTNIVALGDSSHSFATAYLNEVVTTEIVGANGTLNAVAFLNNTCGSCNSGAGGYGVDDLSVAGSLFHKVSVASNLTLEAITGSTQCLQVNTSGVVSGTGSVCGSGPYLPLAGGTMTGTINAQSIVPTANNTYGLGTSADAWINLYVGGTAYVEFGQAGQVTLSLSEWQPATNNQVALGDASHAFAFSYFAGFQSSSPSVINTTSSFYVLGVTNSNTSGVGIFDTSVGGSEFQKLFVQSGGIVSNGNVGVSCSGTPTSSFASVNGIVTHC